MLDDCPHSRNVHALDPQLSDVIGAALRVVALGASVVVGPWVLRVPPDIGLLEAEHVPAVLLTAIILAAWGTKGASGNGFPAPHMKIAVLLALNCVIGSDVSANATLLVLEELAFRVGLPAAASLLFSVVAACPSTTTTARVVGLVLSQLSFTACHDGDGLLTVASASILAKGGLLVFVYRAHGLAASAAIHAAHNLAAASPLAPGWLGSAVVVSATTLVCTGPYFRRRFSRGSVRVERTA